MLSSSSPEVLVVGAGPVGLLSALMLTKSGVRVAVIDKEWRTGAHSYALALHADVLPLLDEVGLLPRVLQQAHRVRAVAVYDGDQRRCVLPLADDDDRGALAVLRQDVLEALLEEELKAHGVAVGWNQELAGLKPHERHLRVEIDQLSKEPVGYAIAHTEWVVSGSRALDVPFVVGADGYQSTVRRLLGIEFVETARPQQFAVFECRTDFDFQHEMRVVFGQNTLDAAWPLPGGTCRFSFQLLDDLAPENSRQKDRAVVQLGMRHFVTLNEDNLRRFLSQRMPWFDGRVEEVVWKIVVRFEHRLAESFGQQRVWLAGDAAHTTGPVGMQSMNVGLREGATLARLLADVLQHHRSFDALEAYGRQSRAEWQRLFGPSGGLRSDGAVDPWIAARAPALLPCLPATGSDLERLAGQLHLGLPEREVSLYA